MKRFLWVNLQLARLCQVTKDRQIKDMLQSLPRGLEGTYSRIISQIEEQEDPLKHLAIQCLVWVLWAKKPLTTDEFQNAVSMDNSITTIKQWDLEGMRDILSACANLVIEERGHISLVHFSAQEFLTS